MIHYLDFVFVWKKITQLLKRCVIFYSPLNHFVVFVQDSVFQCPGVPRTPIGLGPFKNIKVTAQRSMALTKGTQWNVVCSLISRISNSCKPRKGSVELGLNKWFIKISSSPQQLYPWPEIHPAKQKEDTQHLAQNCVGGSSYQLLVRNVKVCTPDIAAQ